MEKEETSSCCDESVNSKPEPKYLPSTSNLKKDNEKSQSNKWRRLSPRLKIDTNRKSDPYLDKRNARKVGFLKDTKELEIRPETRSWIDQKESRKKALHLIDTIKSGQIVRETLKNKDININEWYFEKVEDGDILLVDALFKADKNYKGETNFDKNFCNSIGKSALRISMEKKDLKMFKLLLENKVIIRDCLFHSITQSNNDLSMIQMIIEYNYSTIIQIPRRNSVLPMGITPFQFAAWQNKYLILKFLYEKLSNSYKFDVEFDEKSFDKINAYTWENSIKRRWVFETRCSPAFITLMQEVDNFDPFDKCIKIINDLRFEQMYDSMFTQRYKELEVQVEKYMCDLLSRVRNSSELQFLFEYEDDGSNEKSSKKGRLIDKACENDLKKFICHQNTQFAVEYMKRRNTLFLRSHNRLFDFFLKILIGLLFPLLSILHIVIPKSKLGTFITYPEISFYCNVTSDLMFVSVLIANLQFEINNNTYLGMPPSPYEIMVVFWIMGKWLHEIYEFFWRGYKSYFADLWNYIDAIYLSLFTVSIICRIVDYSLHYNDETKLTQKDWKDKELRLTAQILQSYAYVFVFSRVLSILRSNRTLGPLQVSLSHMAVNIVQFLVIFLLILIAFSMGLTHLFYFYGTEQGQEFVCGKNINDTCQSTAAISFQTIPQSISTLFWALFEPTDVSNETAGSHTSTTIAGHVMLVIYQITAAIVLINMLIAMMALSFENVSKNSDETWRFYRITLYMRYICDASTPSPFNLIPKAPDIFLKIKKLFSWLKTLKCCKSQNREDSETLEICTDDFTVEGKQKQDKRENLINHLVGRYKKEMFN